MAIVSNVQLSELSTGLNFDISINIPEFRQVQFIFFNQGDWWLVSVDGKTPFRISTYTKYNLCDFISTELDFTFQLLPKNLIVKELGGDNISDFYLRIVSSENFDFRPPKTIDANYIYSDKVKPFDDFTINIPSSGSLFSYLTSSNIENNNLDIVSWKNLIGDDWDDISGSGISINTDYNINSAFADSSSVIKKSSNIGNNIESAPTVFLVFKPESMVIGTEYNLIQLGTDNDVYISITKINSSQIQYKVNRGLATTLDASYSDGDVIGVLAQVDKSAATFLGGQSIWASTGEETTGSNNNIADAGGDWGFFSNNSRNLLQMQIIEAALLPPLQVIDSLNGYISYLNKKYGLSFTPIPT